MNFVKFAALALVLAAGVAPVMADPDKASDELAAAASDTAAASADLAAAAADQKAAADTK
ncbi:MAG: hypothetical protein JSS34_07110 [Proteobacteria bacterium]|nr:hypothetical protein [Pseudomonadota bacterium]